MRILLTIVTLIVFAGCASEPAAIREGRDDFNGAKMYVADIASVAGSESSQDVSAMLRLVKVIPDEHSEPVYYFDLRTYSELGLGIRSGASLQLRVDGAIVSLSTDAEPSAVLTTFGNYERAKYLIADESLLTKLLHANAVRFRVLGGLRSFDAVWNAEELAVAKAFLGKYFSVKQVAKKPLEKVVTPPAPVVVAPAPEAKTAR